MHVAVIGAGGKSGRIFVQKALQHGYTVTANVHSRNPFSQHENLTVVFGDATESSVIAKTIRNCDAVVSLVGHGHKSAPNIQTIITKNIVSGMKAAKISRIVSLTGTGVRLDGDQVSLPDQVITKLLLKVDPTRINDGIAHVQELQRSNLDWTVIRVLKLQNTAPRRYTLREHGPAKLITSRHEVASAIITVLDANQFVHKSPVIGN